MLARTARDLGLMIREHRRRLGLEQRELAERVGVSRQWIIEIEKGKARAPVELVLRTLTALDLALDIRPLAQPGDRTHTPLPDEIDIKKSWRAHEATRREEHERALRALERGAGRARDARSAPADALRVEPGWREAAHAVPLSLSMPLAASEHGAEPIEAFMWGLLPDNERVLERWARQFHVSARNPMALLAHVGEDCAGAVQFVPPERTPAWTSDASRSR